MVYTKSRVTVQSQPRKCLALNSYKLEKERQKRYVRCMFTRDERYAAASGQVADFAAAAV